MGRGPAVPLDTSAYLIYTSGSTGTPKGVVVEHRGLANTLLAAREEFGFKACDVAAVLASYAFDIWAFEALVPLLAGGMVRVVPRDDVVDVQRLVAELEGVSVLHAVPALMRQVAAEVRASGRGTLPRLRLAFVGGDAVPPDLLAEMREVFPAAEVRVLYGPTEATILASSHRLDEGERVERSVLGAPLGNVRAYVLDARGGPTPLGVAGELYVGGRGVARGYLGRPELTAERFVPDPFGGEAGARLYRTGDRARRLADGTLEFLGRTDAQVKVRGFRIEPGEVEAALAAAPGVRDAVVVAREDAPGERRLVGYAVPADGGTTAAGLRAHLAARLPEHMVPSAIVLLEAMPLTPTGKADRRALPAPDGAHADAAPAAARTPTAEVLAGMWGELLGLERVGPDDGFFELGGHSLLATQLASRVRRAFGVELPVRAVFEAPTPAALAERVDAAVRAGQGIELPPLERTVPEGADAPLSFAQERLWLLQQMDPAGGAYNMSFALRLRGALDAAALRAALDGLAARHASLRTVFPEADGRPVQRVLPAAPVPLPVEDLSGIPEAGRAGRARALAAAEARRPFDLVRGPLFRAALVRTAADEHLLLLSLHHAVADGWSMGVLFRDLGALYAAGVEGRAPALPEPRIGYADFAAWQRGWLAGETLERQVAFWRERLAGAPPVLELPLDRPRPPVQATRGAEHPFVLPAELRRALEALSRGEGATLFMTLLAAWQLLLARYAGEDDVTVGTPIAGRTHEATEDVVGMFVNTLALRTDLSGDPTFRELLGRVRRGTLDAYAHQDLPFEKLVEELAPERSLSHHPLFQVFFALQNAPAGGLELPGLAADALDTGAGVTKFDLSLGMGEAGDALGGVLTYAVELFDAATVERMAGHFRVLLERIAAAPDARVSALSPLDDAEAAATLHGWNATERELPPAPVHELFAAQAAATPEAIAVAFGSGTVTYAELNARADDIAARLRALGAGPESRVGICLERGPAMLAAVLGALKSGAAYVPLDPAYPAERIRFVAADAGLAVLLTEQALVESVPSGDAEVVLVDGDGSTEAAFSASDRALTPRPPLPMLGEGEHDSASVEHSAEGRETLPQNWGRVASLSEPGEGLLADASSVSAAYLIYTSGSTGTPKGVVVEHRGLANTLLAAREEFGFKACDVAAVLASYAFDIWAFEALVPLLAGGMVRVVPRDDVVDVQRLVAELEGVSVLHAVPALMRQVAAEVRASGRGTLPRLRLAFVGGDAVPPDLLAEMREVFPAAEVRVLYGPTEATILASSHRLDDGERVERNVLGAPLGNVRAYVLDARGEPTPLGVAGELYVGGRGVARGYLGRPELTAERFVPDPYGGEAGARLYRTGDRARRLGDGTLEFLGRTDAQVKIRGFRIEPGEVEAVLSAHPSLREAAVVAREDAPGERRLVGYASADPEAPPVSAGELRAWLRERLPEHMVPAEVLLLEALPLTATGKVDRRALPAPERPLAELADEMGLHRTPTEEVVAAVWADVLRLPRVGATDNFFALGGHSLLATQVASRLRAAFRVDVPVRAVFEAPTVAELAERVDAAVRAGQGIELPPLARAGRDGPLPLSFAQERLWVIDRMDPGGSAYNMPFTLRLRGELDEDALRAALDALVERHESLRTVFPAAEGRPVQLVRPAGGAPFRRESLDGVPAEEREARALAAAAEESWRPFDLAEGPLFRAALFRVAADDHVLVLAQHHAVTDGWSMGVLFRELSALYSALVRGEPSPLAPLPLQYADFAVWQRGWLAGETLERQVAFWRRTLAGAPPLLELPTDRPRPAVQTTRGGAHRFRLPAATLDALRAVSRAEGATLFMTALAGFQLLLARYSRQDDLVVGTPIAGRTHEALEGMVGMFVNTLALRAELGGDPAFRELLGRVRETTLGAYAHQDLPFEKLVDELQPRRETGHSPVFQVMFSLANLPAATLQLPGLVLEPVQAESGTTKFDLSLSLVDAADGLFGALEYNAELFDAGTVERMGAHLATLLEGIAADPARRLSELPLADEAERRRLAAWNDTARELPPGLVHERIAGHARARPDAPAVCFGDSVTTFGELDARAEELAARLRALGVGPEVRVGIAVERGPGVIAAALAVLKAGGAYVPLDPEYPADRLAFMLEDSAAPVVLTQSALAGRLPAFGGAKVLLDADGAAAGDALSHSRTFALPHPPSPDNAAYVIYTSGSTGRPKGVVVPHRGAASFAAVGAEEFAIGPGDVALSQGSFSFDVWVLEVLLPLAAGAAVRPLRHEQVLDLDAQIPELERVTVVSTVPAPMRMLAARLRAAGRTLPGIRLAFCGADVVPPELLREMGEVFPAAELRVLYGPTESTVAGSCLRVGEVLPERNEIGRALGNVTLHVCGPGGEPLPTGVPGELWMGGAQLARGYLGRPELTAEKFVPDPFGAEPGARLYRTGDLVRRHADGGLEFLGRIDSQVKVRGFRVELGEIEAVLARHPAVRGAAALVREDRPGDRRIVAYLEAAADFPAEEARDLARAALPEYMVPAAVVVLESFPLNPSGKLDRRALPAPEAAMDDTEETAPRTALERAIAAAWEEVLGAPVVGVHRSFFDLGGNSLLVVQAAARLEAALGRKVQVLELFQHSTVAALARHLAGGAEEAEPAAEGRQEKLAAGKGRLGQLRRRTRDTER
ncbi:MAG TPA: amino acid adenylation domain-containing protein [Longimicrobiaceae bacterium]